MFRSPSVTRTASRVRLWSAIGFIAGAAFAAGSARAQSASGTLSSYRTGYGGAGLSGLESPVSPSLISAGGQYSISDGVNSAGSVGSVFTTQTSSSPTSGGAGQSYTGQSYTGVGVGQGAVSNGRAPLAVLETPTANSAGASAQSGMVLNGKLNLDGGQ
jgi:hypothetical protein